MTRTASRFSLRVEDFLACAMVVLFLGYLLVAWLRGMPAGAAADMWTVSFVALPMSVIIFMASLRYALGREESTFSVWMRDVTAVIRDWLPFLLFLLLYSTFYVRIFSNIHPATLDHTLLSIDRFLCGETPSVYMQSWYSPALTNFLSLCYFLHLVFPAMVAALWYRRNERMFRELLLAVLFCGAIGTIGYLFVPGIGPGMAFPQLYTKTFTGALYHPIIDAIDQARAPRDVFPSLHVAISALVLWSGFRRGWIAFFILLPFVVGNWVSTVYLRYHYFIDVLAGLVTTALAVALANFALRVEERLTRRNGGLEH
jgi:membrane-associated phospholipid phosphatase